MKNITATASLAIIVILGFSACKKNNGSSAGTIQLAQARIGSTVLQTGQITQGAAIDSSITVMFNQALDPSTVNGSIYLTRSDNAIVPCDPALFNENKGFRLDPLQPLDPSTLFRLHILPSLKGSSGETFPGVEFIFQTGAGSLRILAITVNGQNFQKPAVPKNIDWEHVSIEVTFNDSVDPSGLSAYFSLSSGMPLSLVLSGNNKKVTLSNTSDLADFAPCFFDISSNLVSKHGYPFEGFTNKFYTLPDSTPKFPVITDDQLLTLIQERTFRYFYDFAHPVSGMARERNSSGDIVTSGGSGFGVMALIVGMERGFISRAQGLAQLEKILGFLETCDRFHGAWPHWLNGVNGSTVPFSPNDNGADLVETSYMVEGLMTMRQYLDPGIPAEASLINRIDALTDAVEYDWFTRGQNVLYWHWSPNLGWVMNMPIQGYNETLITYIVAAASTTHPVPAATYTQGYSRNGAMVNGNSYYGYPLPLGEPYGGPLFFTHYTFLGLDPRNLSDQFANYWTQNVNQSMINYTYCLTNPKDFYGYSNFCWGLTASDNPWGYSAHSPTNDLGVITPTAAISAIAFTPVQSMNAIRFFYYTLGDRLWGEYGFYDAFDPNEGWWADSYLAIDQGPIVCMIENHRTGLLWNLFMSHPKVGPGLTKLGFSR